MRCVGHRVVRDKPRSGLRRCGQCGIIVLTIIMRSVRSTKGVLIKGV